MLTYKNDRKQPLCALSSVSLCSLGIQRKPDQTVRLICKKQRNIQHIIVQLQFVW